MHVDVNERGAGGANHGMASGTRDARPDWHRASPAITSELEVLGDVRKAVAASAAQ